MYSIFVMKTGRYKLTYIVCCIAINIGKIWFYLGFIASVLVLQEGPRLIGAVYVCIAFAGFNLIPIIPLSYDFGSEIAYPVSEAVVCGSELIVAQLWGTLDVSGFKYFSISS